MDFALDPCSDCRVRVSLCAESLAVVHLCSIPVAIVNVCHCLGLFTCHHSLLSFLTVTHIMHTVILINTDALPRTQSTFFFHEMPCLDLRSKHRPMISLWLALVAQQLEFVGTLRLINVLKTTATLTAWLTHCPPPHWMISTAGFAALDCPRMPRQTTQKTTIKHKNQQKKQTIQRTQNNKLHVN